MIVCQDWLRQSYQDPLDTGTKATHLASYERASETDCVPTLHDPLLVPVYQMFMYRIDLSGRPYEISDGRISVPAGPNSPRKVPKPDWRLVRCQE